MQVEYGSDSLGSGFPDRPACVTEPAFGTPEYVAASSWNIKNVAFSEGSTIRHVAHEIPGINQPWLYWGMLFATFCWYVLIRPVPQSWKESLTPANLTQLTNTSSYQTCMQPHRHVEDLYLPSINYLHFGDAKQWYGIPRAYAKKFRDVMAKTMKLRVQEEEDLEHAIVAMISPETLNAHGVPVFKAVQRAGEFIVTFPEAFHCGFSYGFNVGEAANFATEDWIAHGSRAVHDYRIKAKREVFSFDRLLFTLASNLDDLQNPALLLGELERVGMEEIRLRERLVQSGVARMPNPQVSEEAIAGSEISEADAAFDDMRVCHLCQHTCFLSAVVSDSSETQVACPRCFDGTRSSQSAVIEWYSDAQIRSTIKAVSKFVRSHSASKGKRRNKKRAAASLG